MNTMCLSQQSTEVGQAVKQRDRNGSKAMTMQMLTNKMKPFFLKAISASGLRAGRPRLRQASDLLPL